MLSQPEQRRTDRNQNRENHKFTATPLRCLAAQVVFIWRLFI
jgi:hypothetical protein